MVISGCLYSNSVMPVPACDSSGEPRPAARKKNVRAARPATGAAASSSFRRGNPLMETAVMAAERKADPMHQGQTSPGKAVNKMYIRYALVVLRMRDPARRDICKLFSRFLLVT